MKKNKDFVKYTRVQKEEMRKQRNTDEGKRRKD